MRDWLSSGVGGLVAGATIGLLLGVFFEDLLKDWVGAARRFLKRWTGRNRQIPDFGREFQLGPLRVPCIILEGDGEHVIEEKNLRVLVNPVEVEPPRALADRRAVIAGEQFRKREAGENHAWNGLRYTVEDLIISWIGPHENPSVTLILKHSDYFNFLATQQPDRRLPGGVTLRSLYMAGREPREIPDFMRSSFGLNVAVVSRDKDSQSGKPPNLFDAARRGVLEELHLLPNQYKMKMLAFHVDISLSQWGALFVLRLNSMSKANLESHLSRGIEDGWEHSELTMFRTSRLRFYVIFSGKIEFPIGHRQRRCCSICRWSIPMVGEKLTKRPNVYLVSTPESALLTFGKDERS
jgi:hypothetical protein